MLMIVALLYNSADLVLSLMSVPSHQATGIMSPTLENSSFSSHSRNWGTDLSR